MCVIINPVTNTQTFSNIQICHLTRLNIQPLNRYFCFEGQNSNFLQLPWLPFEVSRLILHLLKYKMLSNLRARRKVLWTCSSRINLRKFSQVQNAKKKSYPKSSSFPHSAIEPSDAFRKAKDLFQNKYTKVTKTTSCKPIFIEIKIILNGNFLN